MKKHIFGLVIFSFIVGAAAFVCGIFSFSEIADVSVPQYIPAEQTHCNFGRQLKTNSLKINQAVLNLKTGKFNWTLITPKNDPQVVIHFFSKDNKGMHFIKSQQIPVAIKTGQQSFDASFNWLNERKSYDNLYVTAESFTNYDYANDYQPVFDELNATPVTIDYGK